jgi:hypothetical protein
MDDLDTIYADMEELRDDIAMMKRAYGSLTLPKRAHDMIRELGYQKYTTFFVPTVGPSGFTLEVCLQGTNGDLALTLLDMCGSRLWHGTWKDAS